MGIRGFHWGLDPRSRSTNLSGLMSIQALQSLATSYPTGKPADLIQLAGRYAKRREQEILDILSTALDVSTDSMLNLGLEPESDPLVLRAFNLQYPRVDPSSLVGASTEQLEGYTRGVKGKYFEVLVEKRLNDGEQLGELTLAPGQLARLADSPIQRGWDLQIINPDGSIDEVVQLKASQNLSYIKQAIERFPDIRVATPVEIDGAAEELLQTNISLQELTDTTTEQLTELGEDAVTDALQKTAEWIFDAVPIFPAVLIAVTEGRAVVLGRSSLDDALRRSASRVQTAAVFSTLGATLAALDAGVITVPTTIASRIAWGQMINRIKMGEFIQSKTEALRLSTSA